MLCAEKVIAVSEEIKIQLEQVGVSKKSLIVVTNGIDTDLSPSTEPLNQIKMRKELGLQEDSLIVGSLGRLSEQKDYGMFLRAGAEVLKQRSNTEFIVAGDGHLRSELISFSSNLGIDNAFHFIGFRKDVVSILKLMDIFVLSSLDEGLPIALLEAMSLKVPVIVTKVGGIPKVIKNGINGILIEKGNNKQLSENIIILLNDDILRKSLAENAYHTVTEEYSNHQMTIKYVEIYKDVLENMGDRKL